MDLRHFPVVMKNYSTNIVAMNLLFLIAATAATVPHPVPVTASECSIRWKGNDELSRRVREQGGFDFEGYDRLCQALHDKRQGIWVTSDNGVLRGRAYGWVLVCAYDIDTGVKGTERRSTITIRDDANSVEADDAEISALNSALGAVAQNPQLYIRSVDEEIGRLRSALKVGK